jgi:hypothetical protein
MAPRMSLENSGSPISCIAPGRWDSGSSLSSADFSVDDMSSSSTTVTKKSIKSIIKKKESIHRSRNATSGAKKRIEFTKQNEVFPVEHLDDMTPQEISNIWYDPKEYAEIKSSYQVTIFLMETAESNDKPMPDETDEHTIRGLEYRTQTGAWARYEKKRDAYNAVLDEQDRQWKVDCDDHERLAEVYLKHSTKCCSAAYQRGLEDAIAAREICANFYRIKKKGSSSKSLGVGLTKESSRTNTSISSKNNCDNDSRLSKVGATSSSASTSSSRSKTLSSRPPQSMRDSLEIAKDHIKSSSKSSSSSNDDKVPSRGVSRTKSSSSSTTVGSKSSIKSSSSPRKSMGTVAV